MKSELTKRFIELFGGLTESIRYFHAPGRVNIIGEHIDYNGGYVLPFATDMGTYALIRIRDDRTVRFASTNFENTAEISLDNISYDEAHDWANYPKGIIYHIQQSHKLTGFDVLFCGNIPNGAGLSSSASIELVMAVAVNNLFNLNYDMIDLVKLAQKSENNFCGVNCGIMDQFAVGMSRKDHAIYLHCDSLEYKYVPMFLGDYKIIIMDTNKRRQLNESKYNERRAECEQALDILSKECVINQLTDLTPETFEKCKHIIKDPVICKRAKHVVFENDRVKLAVEALAEGNLADLGALLTKSHASLRHDYEVSCKELDKIVEEALEIPGCLGARMTGAGFGGCAIALVNKNVIEHFIETVSLNYEKAIGYAPALYVCDNGHGAREI